MGYRCRFSLPGVPWRPVWTPDVIRLALLIAIGASLVVQHLRLLRRALRTRSLSLMTRLSCLVPPVPVYVAFRYGARRSVWVWLVLVLLYAALWRYGPVSAHADGDSGAAPSGLLLRENHDLPVDGERRSE